MTATTILFSEIPASSKMDSAPIYVIDDSSEMRQSLHFILSTMGLVSWPFASGEDFFEQFSVLSPAPILLDIRMQGLDGIEILTELNARGCKWPVIVMTGHGDIEIAVSAMKLGAIEFLEKPFESEALQSSLAIAQARLETIAKSLKEQLTARASLAKLTKREDEVIRALSIGGPNKQVAHELRLSTRTVEMHRANALAKLEMRSIAEVVALIGKAA